jgi:hypothetical protein
VRLKGTGTNRGLTLALLIAVVLVAALVYFLLLAPR